LFQLAVWYRQLWAENLGKREDAGPTPVAALGAVDQHSQLQLYQDGPKDKMITFVEVERFRKNLQVPTYIKNRNGGLAAQGHSFEEIIHAERAGTAEALRSAGRPNGTLFIPKVSEESLGACFQFFMFSSAYLGGLLGVNAFNQPGVEAMKKNLISLLSGSKIHSEPQKHVSY
jgi:glucose-6-phosphate isomerase